jgi:hypothetical protein
MPVVTLNLSKCKNSKAMLDALGNLTHWLY